MKPNDLKLIREKHAQLDDIIGDLAADAWLVLAREHSDSATELFTGMGMIGESAFLFTRGGRKVALVADFDVDAITLPGAFEVRPYGKGGFLQPLAELLQEFDPATLALNYSESDALADGLTVGLLRMLRRAWPVTDIDTRLRSAETIVSKLRSQKSPEEIRRIREAVRITELVLDEIGEYLRPGLTEIEVTEFIKERHRHHGVTHSFGDGANVMTGHVGMGHRPAGDARLTPGDTVVVDMGVYVEGYTSDLMRTWYVRRENETSAPHEINRRFEAGRDAMNMVFAAMRPGVAGWEMDAIARDHLASLDIEPYTHELGHQIGRSVHDGGTSLAPLTPRYGDLGKAAVRPNEVYTVEPVVPGRTGGDGPPVVGHEQDVLVTESGVEVLSTPPRDLPLV